MLFSEHVYCVAITFKITKWGEQWICNKFWVKLDHSSMETIQMIQKAAAMGNWWLATSSWQRVCSFITPHEVFLQNIKSPRWLSTLYSPDLAPCDFWLFQKLKSPLKGKRFQIVNEIQKIWWGGWWRLGELCEVLGCLLWRGLRCHCYMSNVPCILYLLQ